MIKTIGNHTVSDTRIVTIYSRKKGVEDFKHEVPSDFVVTPEWVNNIMKDQNKFLCLDWFEKKGFVEDENGVWNYDGDKKRVYRIPICFFDLGNKKMRYNIGRTGVNTEKIRIPFFRGGLCSVAELPDYPSNHKFYMDRDPDLDQYDNDSLSWFERSFFHGYTKHQLEGTEGDVNNTYFKLIFDMAYAIGGNNEKERESIIRWVKLYQEEFEKFPDFLKHQEEFNLKIGNFIKSSESIEKFKL